MPIVVTTVAVGINHLQSALKALADDGSEGGKRGKRWMRNAMLKSGKSAFQIAIEASAQLAPVKTGLAARSLTSTNGIYYDQPRVNRSGRLAGSKYKQQYTIQSTLSSAFANSAQKDRKGRAKRYPFMLEVGVPSQKYERVSSKGVLHIVDRQAPRNVMAFQHRGLGATSTRVVRRWNRRMAFYLGLFAKSTYATLGGALRSYKRTGGKGRKWL